MSVQMASLDFSSRLDQKLQDIFPDKVVLKSLSRQAKTASNVPAFVLEFLLSKYCGTREKDYTEGLSTVRKLLSNNYLALSERQKELSLLRSKGEHIIIDHVQSELDLKRNAYVAELSSLGLSKLQIADKYPESYNRLLCGGLWCLVKLRYTSAVNRKELPISIEALAPIPVPEIDLEFYQQARRHFSKNEWIDVLLRSIGIEPTAFTERERWLLLLRIVPLCEKNYNLCELGPRSTGKSYAYKKLLLIVSIALVVVALLVITRLLSLLLNAVINGMTIIQMNLLLSRIQHVKVIDNRARLIEHYNNRVHQISERAPIRLPKLLKFMIAIIIIAAIALCIALFVRPDLEVCQRAVKIYRSIEVVIIEK